MYAMGAVAYTRSVMILEMAWVYAIPIHTTCDQHSLSVIRVSHLDARGLHRPKCCITGNTKLNIVANTIVDCRNTVMSASFHEQFGDIVCLPISPNDTPSKS